MKLIDTHCHLNDPQLYQNLDEIISRALKTGVEKMIVIGWDKESCKLAIQMAEQYSFIYACVGVHPENIEGVDEKELYDILSLSSHPKVVGIGEIGLDFHWEKDPSKREMQKELFIKQIEYANKVGLPISIHSRDAFQDTVEILKQHRPQHSGVDRRADEEVGIGSVGVFPCVERRRNKKLRVHFFPSVFMIMFLKLTPSRRSSKPNISSTVAATSEKLSRTPSGAAQTPSPYTSRGTYSREWSVLSVAGSQPWSAVMMRTSSPRSFSSAPPSQRSNSLIARA